MKIHIGESYDSFRKLRENSSYYVDKTIMLKEYLDDNFKPTVLFTRPRRFGKTMTMTMFRDFLDVRQNSKDIFDGLEIMNHPQVVEKYMNKFPVVFISLKEVFGESFEAVLNYFKMAISELFDEYKYLLDNNSITEEKELFITIQNEKADQEHIEKAISFLCRILKKYYKKPAFVIIDEYDVPMAKALDKPYYDKVRDMIEHMLSYVCKTNDNVKAVILSGCLYAVKNSAYTGVNNIVPYTVLSNNFASSIGFTDDNVKKILEDAGITDRYDEVSEWYDGYIFGNEKMYCPWDVLRYVSSVLDGSYSEDMGPESYWVNTSETAINLIRGFLGKTSGTNEAFEQLLADKTLDCVVKDNLPYHRIHESGDNIWSTLVETGYLTKATTKRTPLTPIRIPNKSIQIVFRQEVWSYFKDKIDNEYVRNFVKALWSEDTKSAEAALNQILEATLSFYHEYREYSYHLILDGFFTGIGYRVQSERESGYGRTDLIILDPARSRSLILELKHVKNESELETALKEATSQIIVKKYESQLKYEGYENRLKYAMAFCDKKVLITKA